MSKNDSHAAGRTDSYHHGDLRRELVQHGLALLEDSDDAQLSLRQLARMAGVSPGAAYRHFANKEALLVALAVEGFERLTQEQALAYLQVQQQSASALDAFRAGGCAYVNFARRQPALFRLMFGRFSATHRNDALLRACDKNRTLLMLSIRKILGEKLDPAILHLVSVATWSMIHGLSALILDQQLAEKGETLDALVEQAISLASEWESLDLDRLVQSRQ